jgi:hypothetical protein
MQSMDFSTLAWRKSSHSESGNCVEVANQDESVFIRDSKDPDGPVLCVSPSAWRGLIQMVRRQ